MNLEKLAEPFPLEDIEWRVSRSGVGQQGIFCWVLAFITARAIQKRLDDVCGPSGWRNEAPRIVDVNGRAAFVGGISILIDGEWITKWDVSEPTNVPGIDPAKGGFSGAMKRAGAQWGIGRYLYYLDAVFADTSDEKLDSWNYAKLGEKHGHRVYYWRNPALPGWALPKEKEHEVKASMLNDLKSIWKLNHAMDVKSPAELRNGFSRFVTSIVGEFPHSDHTCWTRDGFDKCMERAEQATTAGIDSDVPFGE